MSSNNINNPNLPKPQPSQAEREKLREQILQDKQEEIAKTAPARQWSTRDLPIQSPLLADAFQDTGIDINEEAQLLPINETFKESPESLAARTKVMASQEPPKANDQKSPETNEQTNSPGAEPPKDPGNNDAAHKAKQEAREKEVLAEWKEARSKTLVDPRLIGGAKKPITSEEARILIKNGVKDFSTLNFERKVQLNDLDLSLMDFSSAKLPEANFANSKMSDCDFKSAYLPAANFKNSELKTCLMDNANLMNSSFKDASLNSSLLDGAKLIRSDLSNASLNRTRFYGAEMQLSNWQKAKITGESPIYFINANFSGEDFTLAPKEFLEKANFTGANCNHANFAGIELPISCLFDPSFVRTPTAKNYLVSNYTSAMNANFQGTVFIKKDSETNKNLLIHDAILSSANFAGADLRQVRGIRDTVLIGANLQNTKTDDKEFVLDNCDIRLSDLRGSNFSKWLLCGPNKIFNCKVDQEQHERVKAEAANPMSNGLVEDNSFTEACLKGLNLEGANLANAIIDSNLTFTNFRNANFGNEKERTQARFIDPEVDGHDLRFADFRGSNIEDAIFVQSVETLTYGTLVSKGSEFLAGTDNDIQGDLRELRALISHRDLSNRNLKGLDLTNLTLIGVDFTNSNIEEGQFFNLRLFNPIFKNNNLKNASLDRVNLSKAKFEDCDLESATFVDSKLNECRFDGSNLKDVHFENADLTNANLLDAVSLENAFLSYDDVAFTAGGHRNVDANRPRTRSLFIERGCDIEKKTGMVYEDVEEIEGDDNE